MHAVLSPSLLSCSLSSLLKSSGALWISKGSEKGRPQCPRGPSAGLTHVTTCPSLLCVNTAETTVLTPHHLTPCRPYIVPSRSRAGMCCSKRTNLGPQTEGHSHSYRRTPRCLTAIIRNKSRSPTAKIPPFPHTSHYRGLFFASILNQQGFVWLRERPTSWGESQLQVRGSRRAREASQKSSQDEKLAFQIDS